MYEQDIFDPEAVGGLGLVVLESIRSVGEKIDEHLKYERAKRGLPYPKSYIIPAKEIRFSNGEGKVKLTESVRGKDIYVLCDIGNYSCKYALYGYENHKGPDEHFQDIKRALSAIGGKAKRVTVLMPLLYASRQDKRKGRESLDCAMALQELERLGVKDIITFDAHNPNVQNAVPLASFENLYATYDIVRTFFDDEPEILRDKNNLLIISPDSGGMERAIYYSSVMDVDVGMFYKRRDFSTVIHGKNPIVQHDYLGRDVRGRNIIIIDDMIASGESILDIVKELKSRGANKVFVATTFALFTEGADKFNDYYEKGLFDRVYSTNLTYVSESIKESPWLRLVDMSRYMAQIIQSLNHSKSIEPLIDSTEKLRATIQDYRK